MEAEAKSEDTALLAKREEVKRHLEADKYKTLETSCWGRLINILFSNLNMGYFPLHL